MVCLEFWSNFGPVLLGLGFRVYLLWSTFGSSSKTWIRTSSSSTHINGNWEFGSWWNIFLFQLWKLEANSSSRLTQTETPVNLRLLASSSLFFGFFQNHFLLKISVPVLVPHINRTGNLVTVPIPKPVWRIRPSSSSVFQAMGGQILFWLGNYNIKLLAHFVMNVGGWIGKLLI